MNAGLTESQEVLLDRVARPSKRMFLRKMLVGANQNDNDREIRRIEKLLQDACEDIKEVKKETTTSNSMLKSVMNVFGFAGGEAKRHKG